MRRAAALLALGAGLLVALAARPEKRPALRLPAEYQALSPEARARHALNRLAFGPRPGEVERLARPGALEAWLERQLDPASIPDEALARRLAALPDAALSGEQATRRFFAPLREAQRARRRDDAEDAPVPDLANDPKYAELRRQMREFETQFLRAETLRDVYSERQLEAVLTDFWFNHFNVDMSKLAGKFAVPDYVATAIRPRVFGNFRDLLGATARHPAMLTYLDNFRSTRAPEERPGGEPEDDRAWRPRGGVSFGLGMFGGRVGAGAGVTVPLGGGGARAETRRREAERRFIKGLNENYARELLELHTLGVDGGYDQRDVTETARIFTGWTVRRPDQGYGFRYVAFAHDGGEKVVLGERYAGGESEGERLLDRLAAHPSTARRIAFLFAQRFVADEPPPALVDRLAAVFTAGRGDLRALTVALIESPEFWSSAGAKTRTPLEWAAAMARASGAESDGGGIVLALRELDMTPFHCQPPTGYANTAGAWLGGGALERRLNLARRFARNEWEGTAYRLSSLTTASDPAAGREELLRALLPEAGESTRAALRDAAAGEGADRADLATFVGLLFAAPEFQKH